MNSDLMLPAPTAGLIASLSAYASVETARNGTEVFASLTLTHRSELDAEARIEQRMRSVAAALGLAPAHELVPNVGPRIAVLGRGDMRLQFDRATYALRLPLPGAYADAFASLGRVLLAVGLDPLPPGAPRRARDAYIARTLTAGRMFCGSADVIIP